MAVDQKLLDFHCHVDLYPEPSAVITECTKRAVRTLAVTTTPKAFRQNVEWMADSKYVRAALGLHPQLVGSAHADLDLFLDLLNQTKYIGEVGLDGSEQYANTIDEQVSVFEVILKSCVKAGEKVLSVHSLSAVDLVLATIRRFGNAKRAKIVLHWFTGTAQQAQVAADLGCYFSINQRMLSSNRGQKLITAMPRDRILTETDGPFIEYRSQPVKPWDVAVSKKGLSTAWHCDEPDAQHKINDNLKGLLVFD